MSELEIAPEPLNEPAIIEDDLTRISELITGDSPDQSGSAGDDKPPVAAPPEPQEIDDPEPEAPAAAKAEPNKIDYDQEVPMPDGGESLTIGQLKDHYQGKVESDKQREQWEDHRIEQDNRQMMAEQRLNELAGLIGKANPALVELVNKRGQATRKAEADSLLRIYPEWADPQVKKEARPALLKAAEHIGLSETEFAHITSHKLIHGLRLLSHYMGREETAKAKLADVKPVLPKGQKTRQRKQSESSKTSAMVERAKGGSREQKNEAISALIHGTK